MEKENLSTIFVFIYMLIAPILVNYGYEINQEIFVSAMVAIVGLLSAIYSAKNPNTFQVFGNGIAYPTEDNTEPEIFDNDAPVEYDDGVEIFDNDDDGA